MENIKRRGTYVSKAAKEAMAKKREEERKYLTFRNAQKANEAFYEDAESRAFAEMFGLKDIKEMEDDTSLVIWYENNKDKKLGEITNKLGLHPYQDYLTKKGFSEEFILNLRLADVRKRLDEVDYDGLKGVDFKELNKLSFEERTLRQKELFCTFFKNPTSLLKLVENQWLILYSDPETRAIPKKVSLKYNFEFSDEIFIDTNILNVRRYGFDKDPYEMTQEEKKLVCDYICFFKKQGEVDAYIEDRLGESSIWTSLIGVIGYNQAIAEGLVDIPEGWRNERRTRDFEEAVERAKMLTPEEKLSNRILQIFWSFCYKISPISREDFFNDFDNFTPEVSVDRLMKSIQYVYFAFRDEYKNRYILEKHPGDELDEVINRPDFFMLSSEELHEIYQTDEDVKYTKVNPWYMMCRFQSVQPELVAYKDELFAKRCFIGLTGGINASAYDTFFYGKEDEE